MQVDPPHSLEVESLELGERLLRAHWIQTEHIYVNIFFLILIYFLKYPSYMSINRTLLWFFSDGINIDTNTDTTRTQRYV